MRCLFCQKPIPVLRRLSDSKFCSDQHRGNYEYESQRQAADRLMEIARGPAEDGFGEARKKNKYAAPIIGNSWDLDLGRFLPQLHAKKPDKPRPIRVSTDSLDSAANPLDPLRVSRGMLDAGVLIRPGQTLEEISKAAQRAKKFAEVRRMMGPPTVLEGVLLDEFGRPTVSARTDQQAKGLVLAPKPVPETLPDTVVDPVVLAEATLLMGIGSTDWLTEPGAAPPSAPKQVLSSLMWQNDPAPILPLTPASVEVVEPAAARIEPSSGIEPASVVEPDGVVEPTSLLEATNPDLSPPEPVVPAASAPAAVPAKPKEPKPGITGTHQTLAQKMAGWRKEAAREAAAAAEPLRSPNVEDSANPDTSANPAVASLRRATLVPARKEPTVDVKGPQGFVVANFAIASRDWPFLVAKSELELAQTIASPTSPPSATSIAFAKILGLQNPAPTLPALPVAPRNISAASQPSLVEALPPLPSSSPLGIGSVAALLPSHSPATCSQLLALACSGQPALQPLGIDTDIALWPNAKATIVPSQNEPASFRKQLAETSGLVERPFSGLRAITLHPGTYAEWRQPASNAGASDLAIPGLPFRTRSSGAMVVNELVSVRRRREMDFAKVMDLVPRAGLVRLRVSKLQPISRLGGKRFWVAHWLRPKRNRAAVASSGLTAQTPFSADCFLEIVPIADSVALSMHIDVKHPAQASTSGFDSTAFPMAEELRVIKPASTFWQASPIGAERLAWRPEVAPLDTAKGLPSLADLSAEGTASAGTGGRPAFAQWFPAPTPFLQFASLHGHVRRENTTERFGSVCPELVLHQIPAEPEAKFTPTAVSSRSALIPIAAATPSVRLPQSSPMPSRVFRSAGLVGRSIESGQYLFALAMPKSVRPLPAGRTVSAKLEQLPFATPPPMQAMYIDLRSQVHIRPIDAMKLHSINELVCKSIPPELTSVYFDEEIIYPKPRMVPSRLFSIATEQALIVEKYRRFRPWYQRVFSLGGVSSAASFWRFAPADLKWLALVLPLILSIWLWPASASSKDGAGKPKKSGSYLEKAWDEQMGRLQNTLSQRASIYFEDDFSAGLGQWQGAEDWATTWDYDKENVIRPGQLALFQPSEGMRDFVMELSGTANEKALGWVWRAKNLKNYHAAKLYVDGVGPSQQLHMERWKVVAGEKTDVKHISVPWKLGTATTVHVRLEVQGNRFTTLVEDQMSDVFEDGTHTFGGVGLFNHEGDRGKVYRISIGFQDDFVGRLCSFFAPHPITKAAGSLIP